MELAQPFITIAELSQVEPVSEGLEFAVFKATSEKFGQLALRVPNTRVYQNANDPNVDAQDLVQQELRILELLHGGPVPVPKPCMYLETADGYPAMLSEYVEDDGSEVSAHELGRLAALIHSTKIPLGWNVRLVGQEEDDVLGTLVQRMIRRFGEFVKEEPSAADYIPGEDVLQPIAEQLRRLPSCLLHLDLRDVNLRVKDKRVAAVLDWSNALFGPAVIDVFRILELGRPGNAFVEAYTCIMPLPKLSYEEETFLRLDAAMMLALVFISEAPDPKRRVTSVARVMELSRRLCRQQI